MKPVMTKAEARAWKRRWKLVNEYTIREARASTPDQRLKELESLYDFLLSIGKADEVSDIEDVRRRWVYLKERARGR